MTTSMLIPFKPTGDNTNWGTIRQARKLVDVIIVLKDNTDVDPPDVHLVDEVLTLDNKLTEWHDWSLRMTLLARALAHYSRHVIAMDMDCLFSASTTREKIDNLFSRLNDKVTYALGPSREMWTPTQYRTDGIWGTKKQARIQLNPLALLNIKWGYPGPRRLHSFPYHAGERIESDIEVLHFGMSTPELRQARFDKYVQQDPKRELHQFDYFIDPTGMTLKDADIPVLE